MNEFITPGGTKPRGLDGRRVFDAGFYFVQLH